MRVSSSLSLKALTSKIHPQLPLNARESDRLLNLLTTSFRKQLDKVHPVNGTSIPDGSVNVSSSRTTSSSQYTATKHLDSILANPLFAIKPSATTFVRSSPSGNEERLSPRVDFDDRVASGIATMQDAIQFLRVVEHGTRYGPGEDVNSAIRAVRSGSTVLEWLRSTGLIASPLFLRNEQIVRHLTRHLILEGRYDAVKETLFINHLAPSGSEHGLHHKELLQFKARIVRQVCHSSIAIGGANLAVQRFLDMILTDKKQRASQFSSKVYNPIGYAVVMTVLDNRQTISHELYDKLLRCLPFYSNSSGLLNALLHLYSPTQPSCTAALTLLKTYEVGQQSLPLSSGTHPQSQRSQIKARKVIVEMCLETATMLINEKNTSDAKWVVEFAKQHFADELGAVDEHELVKVDEAVHDLKRLVNDTKYDRDHASLAFG